MAEVKRGWMAPAAWDVVEGKRMYDEGIKCPKIAEKLGTTANAVRAYAYRHWKIQVEEQTVKVEKPKAEPKRKAKPKPEPEPPTVVISKITGLPQMGPCDADCETCSFVFRPGSRCMPMCDYYLVTGKHRYPDENGKCAVKLQTAGRKYAAYLDELERKKAESAAKRKKRKQMQVSWDTEKGLELWKQGAQYKDIAAVVGSSPSNICIYAGNYWGEYKPLRDAAIKAKKGAR